MLVSTVAGFAGGQSPISVSSAVPTQVAFGPGGHLAYALASTGEVTTLDTRAPRIISQREGGAALLRLGTRIAMAVSAKSVTVFEMETGEEFIWSASSFQMPRL